MSVQNLFAKRLKTARERAGIAQVKLGLMADMDEFSASSRMNHYEQGRHLPDLDTAKRLADILEVPLAYFYCPEEDIAELLLAVKKLSPEQVQWVMGFIQKEFDSIGDNV